VRNVSQGYRQLQPGGCGLVCGVRPGSTELGRLLSRFVSAGREAMGKVYGVLTAMPQGHSWAPIPSIEAQ